MLSRTLNIFSHNYERIKDTALCPNDWSFLFFIPLFDFLWERGIATTTGKLFRSTRDSCP